MRLACTLAVACAVAAAPAPAAAVEIDVLSNRADLISGGDALVAVSAPARVLRNGDDITSSFARRPDGRFAGLVTGLRVGRNELTAQLPDGSGARLEVVNHPIGGPIFSGPQIQPWVCGTEAAGLGKATDAQCNAPTRITYQYKSSVSGTFRAYDPENPPEDVATTTTDQGKTVPYIVRVEHGTQNRGLYALAVLADPKKPWEPWAPQPAWNHKLLVPFGASTSMHHSQDPPSNVMDDKALSRGFMVANSGLNVQGSNANANVSAEALMMLKEHIGERYGSIRYTIGTGCSGGGLQQYMVSSMYPGLLDGIQPDCSFADMWTTAPDVGECHGFVRYFQNNPHQPWVPDIDGHREPSNCMAWDATFWGATNPGRASNCNLPQEQVYHPENNPRGTRCALQDYQVNIWGRRHPSEWGPVEKKIGAGFAARPVDNVGVQYGLRALELGRISPAQFADLNAKAGGFDIDGNPTAERVTIRPETARIAYRSGQVTDARLLNDIPIIDLRGYNESAEIHTSVFSYVVRKRLDVASGNHDNQIIWTWQAQFPILGMSTATQPDIGLRSFLLMDRWLSTIEADRRDVSRARKVRENKPEDAVDACFVGRENVRVTDMERCRQLYPPYGNTRTAAGEPLTVNIIKCQLKPLRRSDYKVEFTDEQWKQLQQAFPTGVCDYSKPGVGQQPAIPWMSLRDGPGGEPLGRAPRSEPLPGSAPLRRSCVSRRRVVFRVPQGARRVRVVVDGRRVRARRSFAVRLRDRPVRVSITARLRGRRYVRRATLHPCRPKGTPSSTRTSATRRAGGKSSSS